MIKAVFPNRRPRREFLKYNLVVQPYRRIVLFLDHVQFTRSNSTSPSSPSKPPRPKDLAPSSSLVQLSFHFLQSLVGDCNLRGMLRLALHQKKKNGSTNEIQEVDFPLHCWLCSHSLPLSGPRKRKCERLSKSRD